MLLRGTTIESREVDSGNVTVERLALLSGHSKFLLTRLTRTIAALRNR